jgi:hypothetical protein
MQAELEKFLSTNGSEWTINRFKAIWTAAIHLKNGDRESARKVYQQASIRYHKGTMYPVGEWGYAVSQFVSSTRPSVLRRWAAVLRVYTAFTLDKPSKAQVDKFVQAVTTPPVRDMEQFRHIGQTLAKEVSMARGSTIKVNVDRSYDSVHLGQLHGTSYYFCNITHEVQRALKKGEKDNFRELLNQPYGKFILSLLTENWAPRALEGKLPYDEVRSSKMRTYRLDSGFNGRVVMLQQQGAKGRTVFQPTASLQLAFLPLHAICNGIAKRLFYREADWDDQVDGVYQICTNLAEGKAIYSVDQSSATDRFPRGISEGILDYFGATAFAEALEEVSNRPWRCDFLSTPVKIATGQPMGLFGSFPLYNLSNLIVAGYAEVQASNEDTVRFPDSSCFKVVGDDIVFSDERVAMAYCDLLKDYGVKISETKSFSGNVAEFAGFLCIRSNSDKETVAFRPYKYPVGDEITNPVDFLHALGIQAAKLGPRWAMHYIAYQSTVSQRKLDLSPFAPANEPEGKQSHALGKEESTVSTASGISQMLVNAYTNGCKELQLRAYVNSVHAAGNSTTWVFNSHGELSRELARVAYVTSSKLERSVPQYDVFSRSDYVRKDNEDRRNGHHVAHRRLKDDPLISALEANDTSLRDKALALLSKGPTIVFGSKPTSPQKSAETSESRESELGETEEEKDK